MVIKNPAQIESQGEDFMSKERIFVVEDENAGAQDIASSLKTLGYVVAGQTDRGEIAIREIEELHPDVVLMDVRLQGQMHGIETAQYIHSHFDIPVVFISAHSDTITMQSAIRAQAYGYLTRPFDERDLRFNIIMALYKHSMESKLRESEERYALAVQAANDGIWDWNLKTNEIYFSHRWKAILGYKVDEIGSDPNEWINRVHPDDKDRFEMELASHVKGLTPLFECEYQIRHANGKYLWALSRGLAVRDKNGTAYRMAGSQSDISARKLAEKRLAHDALHDALTGLPNRVLFMDRLENRLERTKRNPDDLFALMFIDLDRFKVVNDSLGHAVGDQLLITIAIRLKLSLRPDDTLSRLSGDEFAVLLNNVSSIDDVQRVADRIKVQLVTTTLLGAVERSPSASIGIALFNNSYISAGELLRDADLAMYRAKALGGNRYQLFDQTMHASAIELLKLEADLKHAVERNELLVYYQPIVSLASNETIGVEALVRWLHPRRGMLQPNEFIHTAEDTGYIFSIGEFVLRTACLQAKAWRNAGHPKFWVAVNISSRQFQDKNMVEKVKQVLSETGLPSDGLRIEITENLAIRDMEYTIKIMKELNEMGVHTSLDDFGIGYSSLGYLKHFPLKVLKIDQSFIQDIQLNKKNESLIVAIIAMARALGLEVIAEGVEKDEQLAFLRSQLCDNVQGFLLSHPIPAAELTKLIK